MPKYLTDELLRMSFKDFNACAMLAGISTGKQRMMLFRFLNPAQRRFNEYIETKKLSRAPGQQVSQLVEHARRLRELIADADADADADDPSDPNKVSIVPALLVAAELERISSWARDQVWEHAIGRITKQRDRHLAHLKRELRLTESAISTAKAKGLLTHVEAASKEALHELIIRILMFWRSLGRLNDRRVSLDDRLVKFAIKVVSSVADKEIDDKSMRRRLAAALKKLPPRLTRQIPDLEIARREREAWHSNIADELVRSGVDTLEAKEFAGDVPLDLTLSPAEVAQELMRAWQN